jgi:AAA domain, putative AbiEii toxin, Type IV TA system
MWIKKIKVPPSKTSVPSEYLFKNGVNIVRGDNGIGKTTILECASLLGHVAVMDIASEIDSLAIEVTFCFHQRDVDFLNFVTQAIAVPVDAPQSVSELARILDASGISMAFDEIDAKREYVLRFRLNGIELNDLKDSLSCDSKIRNALQVHGDPVGIVSAVKVLNFWSRPTCEGTEDHVGPWKMTPRTIAKLTHDQIPHECGSTFYINTDMYEFGSGLDVRESPKELKDHLTTVMIRRLQLVIPPKLSSPLSGSYLDELIPVSSGWSIDRFDKIVEGWTRIFESKYDIEINELRHPLKSCIATRLEHTSKDRDKFKTKFEWVIGIGDRSSGQFVSSGENQAIFILAMLANYAQNSSCIIIDEPELHLSFTAGSRLLEYIIDCYGNDDSACQLIMVTHLPHLYRSRIEELDPPSKRDGRAQKTLNFMYLKRKSSGVVPLYGKDAADAAAEGSHEDVVTLSYGLQLDDEIPLFEWSYLFSLPPLSWLFHGSGA